MKETQEFLKAAGVYFIATIDGDKPRVRPFGTAEIFENHLYIQTGKSKDVSKQIEKNPNVEICAFKDGKWINERSPFVDDIRDIINEYPYFEIDCYKQVYKEYRVDRRELNSIKIEDFNEFIGPDLSNKELNINTK